MYSWMRESRGAVSFCGADNNRDSTTHTHCSNNNLDLAELRRAPHHSIYAASPNNIYNYNNTSASSSFPITSASNQIISFHSSNKWNQFFQASKQSNKLVVVYFTATWCGPCRSIDPTIKQFAAMYHHLHFVKIDVDQLFNVSCEYGIQTMPTFLFFKNGKQIDKVTGANTGDLQSKIHKYRPN